MRSLISCVMYLIIIQLILLVVVADYVIYGTKIKPLTTVSVKRLFRKRNGDSAEGHGGRGKDDSDPYGPGGPGNHDKAIMDADGKPRELPIVNEADQVKHRYTTITTKTIKLGRTPPERITYSEQCDYIAKYCLKAYNTGRLCAMTIHNYYETFKSYCMLDYVNCMERYEMWQLAHMGQCYNPKPITNYIHIEYNADSFLDKDIISDDQELG